MVNVVKNFESANYVTHAGKFHADEIFGTVLLEKIFGKVDLIRLPEVDGYDLTGKIVFDIGSGKFDHHQIGGNGQRYSGIKYAAFGLLWKEYGRKYLEQINAENVEDCFYLFDKNFVQFLDAGDNGQIPFENIELKLETLSDVIEGFNPNWDEDVDSDIKFMEALDLARAIFDNKIQSVIAKCKATGETATTESYYIKGIADAEYTVGSYKNVEIDIVDQEGSSDKFKVFRVKDKDGKGIKEGYKISKGATIIVYGPVVNFKGNTPETATGAYLVSVNGNAPEVEGGEGGGGSDTPSGEGDGTEAKPYNVAGVVAAGSGTDVFVKAYIVGWVEGQALATGAHFDANATVASNILIADSPNETDVAKCIPIQLPSGAVRTAVNLKDNAGNYKKEILLVGNIEKYFGTTGIKSTSYAKIGDTEAGTKPSSGEGGGGSDTPSSGTGTLANPLTASQVYDIVAAMESGVTSTEDYYVKGKICSIKFEYSAQYGTATFNISDDGNTGSKEFTAYSTYYHASEQKWKEGDTQVAVGDEVVICGKVVNYNGNTPEFASKKSYVVSISK